MKRQWPWERLHWFPGPGSDSCWHGWHWSYTMLNSPRLSPLLSCTFCVFFFPPGWWQGKPSQPCLDDCMCTQTPPLPALTGCGSWFPSRRWSSPTTTWTLLAMWVTPQPTHVLQWLCTDELLKMNAEMHYCTVHAWMGMYIFSSPCLISSSKHDCLWCQLPLAKLWGAQGKMSSDSFGFLKSFNSETVNYISQ